MHDCVNDYDPELCDVCKRQVWADVEEYRRNSGEYDILGKRCADSYEYDMRLERFQAWARAHPFAYRTPNLSIPACITYVFADRYEPGEWALLKLLGYSNPNRRLDRGEEFDADLESEIPQIKDVRARERWSERHYSAYALSREEYLKNPVGVNRGLNLEV